MQTGRGKLFDEKEQDYLMMRFPRHMKTAKSQQALRVSQS
jgi:hypothetical protein